MEEEVTKKEVLLWNWFRQQAMPPGLRGQMEGKVPSEEEREIWELCQS